MPAGEKRKVGPPVQYTPERIAELLEKMEKYTNDNVVPIIAEFAYLNNMPRETLYEIPELRYGIRKLIAKKEANLEKGALTGKVNCTMAIFSLKQLGWSDRIDTVNRNVNVDVPLSDEELEAYRQNLRAFFPDADLSDIIQEKDDDGQGD